MAAGNVSTVKPGDGVILYPSTACESGDGATWIVPVHAWVYVPQASHLRRGAIAELLRLGYGLDVRADSAPYFDRRINLLLADNKRGRRLVLDIAGVEVVLPPTAADGHVTGEARIAKSAAASAGARLTMRVVLPPTDRRTIEALAELVAATGSSVISDIDDTVKITQVHDKRQMWAATFYQPFEPVAGMAAAYQRLAAGGASFHYVSSSPWHLGEPLLEFLAESRFPVSAIDLKHIRLKDRTALNVTRPGRETKPPLIEAIFAQFPKRTFVLIGDSGEDDPEVYAATLQRHPDQVAGIYIRNITGACRDDARFSRTFKDIEPARWSLFEDPADIK